MGENSGEGTMSYMMNKCSISWRNFSYCGHAMLLVQISARFRAVGTYSRSKQPCSRTKLRVFDSNVLCHIIDFLVLDEFQLPPYITALLTSEDQIVLLTTIQNALQRQHLIRPLLWMLQPCLLVSWISTILYWCSTWRYNLIQTSGHPYHSPYPNRHIQSTAIDFALMGFVCSMWAWDHRCLWDIVKPVLRLPYSLCSVARHIAKDAQYQGESQLPDRVNSLWFADISAYLWVCLHLSTCAIHDLEVMESDVAFFFLSALSLRHSLRYAQSFDNKSTSLQEQWISLWSLLQASIVTFSSLIVWQQP